MLTYIHLCIYYSYSLYLPIQFIHTIVENTKNYNDTQYLIHIYINRNYINPELKYTMSFRSNITLFISHSRNHAQYTSYDMGL